MDAAASTPSTRALLELKARLERENRELRERAAAELQRQNQEAEAYNRRLQRQNDRLRRKLLAASTAHLRSYLEPLVEEAEKGEDSDDASTAPGSEDGRDRSLSGDSLLSEGADAMESLAASATSPDERAEACPHDELCC